MTADRSNFALTPEEFVGALYRAFLGRPADHEGLEYWSNQMSSTGDPTAVLQGILGSPEYAARGVPRSGPDATRETSRALARLGRPLHVVDIGAQSLGAGSHPYEPLTRTCAVDIIGFDPLEDKLRERAASESCSRLTLLPYAVGDGEMHTLYINNDDATSSLFELNLDHNFCFNHLSDLRTVRTASVKTRRLDDVLPERIVDFLKLDVQGAELMVLQAADRTLARTAIVHCEVEFSPIYREQPLFSDISRLLASRNFVLIDLLVPGRYHYLTPSARATEDRLLWADAVFFRETNDPDTLIVQALVAAAVYQKPTLAEFLLEKAGDRRSSA